MHAKSLKIMEASTGIEPVYTDLQSAASPLRQLAIPCGWDELSDRAGWCKWAMQAEQGQFARSNCPAPLGPIAVAAERVMCENRKR